MSSTVTIAAIPYTVYGAGIAAAKTYLGASIDDGAATWNALASDDLKAKFLVEAMRMIERQSWDPDTAATFAVRDAIVGPLSALTPSYARFEQAQYELAAVLAANASVKTDPNSGSNIKTLRAGPVDIEYFVPTISPTNPTTTSMPSIIMDLLGAYLASANAGATVSASGFDSCQASRDNFADCEQFDLNGPLI